MALSPPSDQDELTITNGLRAFTDEYPYERWPILRFVAEAAEAIPAGARVADVGAGMAPYAELFAHVDYVTIDWAQSLHDNREIVSIVASAESVPEPDASFDTILLTQVLEHVPDPPAVLREMHRLLRPGGRLFLTVPLAWELHELPHDYFRHTEPGLRRMLGDAGFDEVDIRARNDCFSTLAQLVLNARWTMGRADDGLDRQRAEAVALLEELGPKLAALAPLDASWTFPLGYAATATRPAHG